MSVEPRGSGAVLVVDDDEALSELISTALGEAGYEVRVARSVAEASALLSEREFDVALLDMHLPDGTGADVLRRLVDDGALTETIVLTGSRDIESAIEVMKLGASDYLVKPTPLSELEMVVAQARERHRLRAENLALRVRLERHEPHSAIVSEDPALLQVIASLAQVGPSDLPVLVQGESGTGKELVARAVHDSSARKSGPFVAINCAAVPDNLLESELFGYERGAFTGAAVRKLGLFEVADRGTLFLDEIGDISAAVQAKLLRVLETKEFFRLGSTRAIRSDVRIVAATNKDLAEMMSSGGFREDLYYRINGVTLRLPPLRDRPADVLPLALHFMRSHGIKRGLSPKALEVLKAYRWPGNVRELQMVIRRAAVLATGELIEPRDLPLQPVKTPASTGETFPDGLSLAQVEDRYIRHVLGQCKGHRARAAARLGISVKTLYNKIGPERPREKDE
ncbi:MAG: sigma-54 dependent transcriptional regulator [Vicinamibacteria bacterium]|nr:sigma-54 dependent transcriptional regulator [Vicinamibacteria bacterium]